MGGHGGLNILPQKRWNVYNYENREKVRRDEEAAAKEEQLKREQARKREAEFRLDRLRRSRGLAPSGEAAPSTEFAGIESKTKNDPGSEPKSNHINLFEGIRFFDPVSGGGIEGEDDKKAGNKKIKMMKKEAVAPRVVTPEDEKYRLGYGIAGKGVKLPWYMAKPSENVNEDSGKNSDSDSDSDDDVDVRGSHKHAGRKEGQKAGGKKTLAELREERLKREKREKERELALIQDKARREGNTSRR